MYLPVELYMFFAPKKRIYLFLNKSFSVCYVSIQTKQTGEYDSLDFDYLCVDMAK